jgi:hypothetical protein
MEIKLISIMLKKEIRKSLVETKENKEKRLIEERLIKNRISIIMEGINTPEDFEILSEDKKFKLSYKLLEELSYLQNNGLITEQGLGSILQSLFGSFFSSSVETMIEPYIAKIIEPLFGKGVFTNIVTSYLTSRPSDIIKSFNDCKLMTKLLAESITEGLFKTLMDNKGFSSPGYVFLRNSLGGAVKNSEFISGIEKQLESQVCKLIGGMTDKAKTVYNKVKSDTKPAIAGS